MTLPQYIGKEWGQKAAPADRLYAINVFVPLERKFLQTLSSSENGAVGFTIDGLGYVEVQDREEVRTLLLRICSLGVREAYVALCSLLMHIGISIM